jgi:hypothetical protein
MKTIRWIVFVLAFVPIWLKADDVVRSAKIIAVTGPVSITTSSGTIPGVVGTPIPLGATVKTAASGEASIQFFDGVVVLVQPDTVVSVQLFSVSTESGVQKENTQLDLTLGGVIATLDPAKKDVSNFKVRTPRGVAAARGTVFSVRVKLDSSSTVSTMSGTVSFMTDRGEVTVGFGKVSKNGEVLSVAEAVEADPALSAEILSAVSSVASSIGSGDITNSDKTPNLVTAMLAALVDVAVQATPNQAPDILRSVIAAAGPALQAAILATNRAGNSDAAAIIQAASESAAEAGVPPTTGIGDTGTILPVIDQTQTIVSPSAPAP